MNAIEETNEDIIVDIKSHKKLINVHKSVLEMFSFLLEEKYFDWNLFKEKLNYYEVICKMRNVTDNLPKYNKKKVNNYLNKISKQTNLNHDYLIETFPGLAYIFNWVKAIFKMYLYKLQHGLAFRETDKVETPERITDLFPTHSNLDLNKLEALKNPKQLKNTITTLESNYAKRNNLISLKTNNNENFTIKSEEYKKTYEKDDATPNIYLTANPFSRNVNTHSHKIITLKTTAKSSIHLNKTTKNEVTTKQVAEKEMKIDIDVAAQKKKTMLKNFKNLPMIHVRTFRQLREYFNPKLQEKEEVTKSPVDLDTFSLKHPRNFARMLAVLQKGNIGNLNRVTVMEFCKNIDKENETLIAKNRKKKH